MLFLDALKRRIATMPLVDIAKPPGMIFNIHWLSTHMNSGRRTRAFLLVVTLPKPRYWTNVVSNALNLFVGVPTSTVLCQILVLFITEESLYVLEVPGLGRIGLVFTVDYCTIHWLCQVHACLCCRYYTIPFSIVDISLKKNPLPCQMQGSSHRIFQLGILISMQYPIAQRKITPHWYSGAQFSHNSHTTQFV